MTLGHQSILTVGLGGRHPTSLVEDRMESYRGRRTVLDILLDSFGRETTDVLLCLNAVSRSCCRCRLLYTVHVGADINGKCQERPFMSYLKGGGLLLPFRDAPDAIAGLQMRGISVASSVSGRPAGRCSSAITGMHGVHTAHGCASLYVQARLR